MGNLANDMTRLREEADTLRNARSALMRDLAQGASDLSASVSTLRADFAAAHRAMVKKTGSERKAFVAGVVREVNTLVEEFFNLRGDQARKGSQDRGAFLSELRRQVSDIRKDTADDIKGARLVWRGQAPLKSVRTPGRPNEKAEKDLPKTKVTKPAAAAAALPRKKEKNRLNEKPVKAASKAKHGKF